MATRMIAMMLALPKGLLADLDDDNDRCTG